MSLHQHGIKGKYQGAFNRCASTPLDLLPKCNYLWHYSQFQYEKLIFPFFWLLSVTFYRFHLHACLFYQLPLHDYDVYETKHACKPILFFSPVITTLCHPIFHIVHMLCYVFLTSIWVVIRLLNILIYLHGQYAYIQNLEVLIK